MYVKTSYEKLNNEEIHAGASKNLTYFPLPTFYYLIQVNVSPSFLKIKPTQTGTRDLI